MENIFLKAYAKINLNLHLIPELSEKGYFQVSFINSQLDIYDSIKISKNNKKEINISVTNKKNCNSDTSIISGDQNLAYKAIEKINEDFKIKSGFDIDIKKNIPIKAGLGGGSCDAAAVINGIDELLSLNLAPIHKVKLAEKLGMDVCYCVIGGLCLVNGIGNIIIPIPYLPPKINNILLVLPDIQKPSTAWAYSIIKRNEIGKNLNKLDGLIKGILMRNIELICKNIWNDFERPISEHFPKVGEIIHQLKKSGACAATLAGSGLTVFSIFENREKMLKAEKQIKKLGYKCLKTSTV